MSTKQYMKDFYRNRLDQGLCAACGLMNDRPNVTLCTNCRVKDGATAKERRAFRVDRGLCVTCGRFPATATQKCNACAQQARKSNNQLRQRLKAETMAAYGGKCMCCGESHIAFLTIDHINGRDKPATWHDLGDGGYRALKKAGYPKDNIQVLCWNCNAAKFHCGTCPHQS